MLLKYNVMYIVPQWNPSIMATIRTKDFSHYREYYINAVGTKMSDLYREGGCSSGVAIKEGLHCSYIIARSNHRK